MRRFLFMEACREKILSEDYYDFLIPDYRRSEEIVLNEQQACIQDLGLDYRAVSVEASLAGKVTIDRYGYDAVPNCYALLNLGALNSTGIFAVQSNPALELYGQGIMIGFVDTGIEYANPVFRDEFGKTRIAGIWDQTVQDGQPPEEISYGSEYTPEMINRALRAEDPAQIVPSRDTDGHGTYLASVAAGGENLAEQFSGAAPRAVLGVVKLKQAKRYLREYYGIHSEAPCYQENDIMQGLHYLSALADRRGLPLVLCVALGTNFGGHNGSSMLSRMLDTYARMMNRCVIIGGGNEASNRHHYRGTFTAPGEVREVEVRVEDGTEGFVAELWNPLPDIVTAYLISPSGERSPTISLREGNDFTFHFVFDGTTVELEDRLLLENSDSQLIFFRFLDAAPGIWKIGVTPLYLVDGTFHIWLPVQEFLKTNVYFLEPDPYTTLTEPGSTRAAITVSYYNSEDNSIDINSGRGYTRCMIRKPDFAVPGVDITGADLYGRFTGRSGSSASVGICAGAAALVMEWLRRQTDTRGITTSKVRNILLFGTGRREDMTCPNREWGYGTIDIYQSLNRLREL